MARFKKYKTVVDFNEWKKTNDPDKIYAITSENDEHYFDVVEEDFIKMIDLGIVNHEGLYYLLNNPTEEQIAEYAAKYGILWIDLENKTNDTMTVTKKTDKKKTKRPLSLNKQRMMLYGCSEEQLKLGNELLNLLKEMPLTNGIRFDSTVMIGDLICKSIEIDEGEISGVLVHWKPDYNISTKSDPFCSVYILEPNEIKTLINIVKDNTPKPKYVATIVVLNHEIAGDVYLFKLTDEDVRHLEDDLDENVEMFLSEKGFRTSEWSWMYCNGEPNFYDVIGHSNKVQRELK